MAKRYQDIKKNIKFIDHVSGGTIETKVPPSWETPSRGPTALLRAAREADDTGLKEIVAQARKVGLRGMDVNVVDGSGRVSKKCSYITLLISFFLFFLNAKLSALRYTK